MGFDLFLLLLVVVVLVVAVAVNVRLLLYYQQSEDSAFASSVFCKTVIVISLTIAWLISLLLPIDVRNSRPTPGPLDMQALWIAAFITLAVFLVLVVPGVMFYHEVEGDDLVKKKRRHVVCHLILTLFFSVCGLAISYPFLSEASIPVVKYACDKWEAADEPLDTMQLARRSCAVGESSHITVKVGFQVYVIAVLCFIGWFFFVMFGGIGLSAVPLDMILAFVDRPRAIDEVSYQQRRRMLGKAAQVLLHQSEELQTRDGELAGQKGWRAYRQKRAMKADYNSFKREVHLLEDELERLNVSKFLKGESLAVSIAKLVLGIIFAILSLTWVLHIILCVLVPQLDKDFSVKMLNGIFEACEGSVLYPLGIAMFAAYTLYLLLCVVKGCLKFGMRVFFLFSIHPMRPGATPLNSILFNVELVLISSAAIVQFEQAAFADYARLTEADVIFAAQVKYMTFYSWFFENSVFIWALLAWFLLSLIVLLVKPREGRATFRADKKADKTIAKLIGMKLGKSGGLLAEPAQASNSA